MNPLTVLTILRLEFEAEGYEASTPTRQEQDFAVSLKGMFFVSSKSVLKGRCTPDQGLTLEALRGSAVFRKSTPGVHLHCYM